MEENSFVSNLLKPETRGIPTTVPGSPEGKLISLPPSLGVVRPLTPHGGGIGRDTRKEETLERRNYTNTPDLDIPGERKILT